jgi:hypothetical protein
VSNLRSSVKAATLCLLLLLALSAFVVGACGGDSGSEEDEAEANAQDARVEFAQCMREEGVDVPDPQPGQEGFVVGGGEIDPNDPAVKAAREKCLPALTEAIPESERPEPAEIQDAALEFARCMREHGIDYPDPQISGEGGIAQLRAPEGVDTNSPAFEAAADECSEAVSFGQENGATTTEP